MARGRAGRRGRGGGLTRGRWPRPRAASSGGGREVSGLPTGAECASNLASSHLPGPVHKVAAPEPPWSRVQAVQSGRSTLDQNGLVLVSEGMAATRWVFRDPGAGECVLNCGARF